MELSNIEQLLDKYFDAETTIAEEQVLKDYFSQDNVPLHLQEYKAMFAYFAQNKKETSHTPIQVNPKKKTWKINWLVTTAAAILLIIVSVYKFTLTGSNDGKLTPKQIAEAERAFDETKKAFQLISKNLNKGNNAIAYLGEYESAKNKIFKNK